MSKNSRLKKVLIVAYYWGTRIPGLVKYLPEFGWQPIILTTSTHIANQPLPELWVIETHYRDALAFWKRLLRLNPDEDVTEQVKQRFGVASSKRSFVDFPLRFAGEVSSYPDLYRGWKPFAIKAGDELLQREDIDAILSSSSPVTSHLVAKELKVRYKIPWVADLRDLWTQNHNYGYGPIRRLLDRRLELKTLSEADALVTVSQPWAEKLSAFHNGKATYAITNGFDPKEVNIPPVNLTTKFTTTYTGTIYTGKQAPSKLFAALRELISGGIMNPDEIEVRFLGSRIEWLDKEIEQYDLSDIVKQYGRVPQQIAIEKQRESQLLMLLNWEDQQEKGVYPLKIFEYMAARRPILATGGLGNDAIKELLEETKAGMYAPSIEDIKNVLRELYLEYRQKGRISYNGDIEKINKYSHREMARKFAEVLDQVTSK